MAKYIKADDLMAGARDFLAGVIFVEKGGRSGKIKTLVESMLHHVIRSAPAGDVVPVVRCEKCAKRGKKDEFFWCKPCGYRCNEKDWFCPAGIRRDEDEP